MHRNCRCGSQPAKPSLERSHFPRKAVSDHLRISLFEWNISAMAHVIASGANSGKPLASEGTTESPEKRPLLRPLLLVIVLAFAVFFGWLLWPAGPEISPYDLSREDGKSRFVAAKPT